jgi:Carboxylesterase family
MLLLSVLLLVAVQPLEAQFINSPPFPNDRSYLAQWDFRPFTNNPLFGKQFELETLSRTVDTPKGKVVGLLVRLHDGPGREWDRKQLHTEQTTPWQTWLNVTVFLGIPYAEPPIGNLRFRVGRYKFTQSQ